LRAKALRAVAYGTSRRLVALRVEDLSFNADTADGVALIRNTKAGRGSAGRSSLSGVLAISVRGHKSAEDIGFLFIGPRKQWVARVEAKVTGWDYLVAPDNLIKDYV
jgi:hypothetical protein